MFCYNNFFVVIVIQLFFFSKTQNLPNSSIKPQFKKKPPALLFQLKILKNKFPFFPWWKKKMDSVWPARKKTQFRVSFFVCGFKRVCVLFFFKVNRHGLTAHQIPEAWRLNPVSSCETMRRPRIKVASSSITLALPLPNTNNHFPPSLFSLSCATSRCLWLGCLND